MEIIAIIGCLVSFFVGYGTRVIHNKIDKL